jgi:hypothetical protein
LTQVSAQEATSVRRDVASPHEAKAAKPTAPSFASLGDIGFTDPYAAPVHPNKLKNSGFLRSVDAPAADPKGGFSVSVGKDSPNEPMSGGLKLRF